jgi:DNA-binding response OmpR family regulator
VDNEGTLVLIVDDEADIRTFLADLLTTQGFHCAWADSGPAALAQLGPLAPDIILLDIMMPGMSGLEVLRQIRERDDVDPAVIMISCLGHPNTTLRALDEGADHFVVKPFRVNELLDTLHQVLERREGGEDIPEGSVPE